MRPNVLLLCLMLSAPLGAAEPGLLDRATAAAQRSESIVLPFTQEKHLALLETPLSSTGTIAIDRRAGTLVWTFDGQAQLRFEHGRLRRFAADGTEEDLGRNPSLQALAAQMRAMLNGDWRPLTALFAVTESGQTATFRPLSPDLGRYIDALAITFGADGVPTALVLTAPGGDRTDYRFGAPQNGK